MELRDSRLRAENGWLAGRIKGSLTRDFRLQVFFMNLSPPGPQVFQGGRFEFFRKFAEIRK